MGRVGDVIIAIAVFCGMSIGMYSLYYNFTQPYESYTKFNITNSTFADINQISAMNTLMSRAQASVQNITTKGVNPFTLLDVGALIIDIPGIVLGVPAIIIRMVYSSTKVMNVVIDPWFLAMIDVVVVFIFVIALVNFIRGGEIL